MPVVRQVIPLARKGSPRGPCNRFSTSSIISAHDLAGSGLDLDAEGDFLFFIVQKRAGFGSAEFVQVGHVLPLQRLHGFFTGQILKPWNTVECGIIKEECLVHLS